MKLVLPGGPGRSARSSRGTSTPTATRSSFSAARPARPVARRHVGRPHARRLGRELDGADVVINLAGPERELPVHCRESSRDSRTRGSNPLKLSATAIPKCGTPAARLAPGQHRDDLRPPYDAPNDEVTGIIGR